MSCFNCKSKRVGSISAKSSDLNVITIGDNEKEGYVPDNLGIGGGDYIEFDWCLNCGQIQGKWPLPISGLESGEDEDEDLDDEEKEEARLRKQEHKQALLDDENESPVLSLAQIRAGVKKL